jgi:hypothetical protein
MGGLDLEKKIDYFEFNSGPLDFVSRHLRRVADEFKQNLYY